MKTWMARMRACGLAWAATLFVAAVPMGAAATDGPVGSGLAAGKKTITLIADDGRRQRVGSVDFVPDGDGARIAVTLDAPEFAEEFLSMRPFRCLPGERQMWCHLAYPYGKRNRITARDLVDLEYELMFIWRTPDRVGADAWNGLYFKLAVAADGAIEGRLHEADFNVLATPPTETYARPVGHGDLTPAETGRRLYDRIEIR
jgi:hypothetical protein